MTVLLGEVLLHNPFSAISTEQLQERNLPIENIPKGIGANLTLTGHPNFAEDKRVWVSTCFNMGTAKSALDNKAQSQAGGGNLLVLEFRPSSVAHQPAISESGP